MFAGKYSPPVSNYLFKLNKDNMAETIDITLKFLLLTLNRYLPAEM